MVQPFLFSTPLQVRFNDVDMMGHVNNAVYQHYFDYGKLNYFNQVFGEQVQWDKTGLVLAKITIDYLLPILLNEEMEVRTKVSRIGNKSLDVSQELVAKQTGEVKSTALSIMVGFSKEENTTMPILDEWRKAISTFEGKGF